ncbi:MAG TPA: HAMP domain-containing sensor histidine kinase [Clostridiales bacterium]|nr:HAMP domain-containing sensor histidine kinase [Clostridiales bacterium]
MKNNTIKWRIFKYNLIVIVLLITLTTIIFNVAVRLYIEKDIISQLHKIASRTEGTVLEKGPDFFPKSRGMQPPPPPDMQYNNPPDRVSEYFNFQDDNELFRFYFMLDRSLREPLSVLNADYILLDNGKNIINTPPMEYFNASDDLMNKITNELSKLKDLTIETYMSFHFSGTEYVAIVKPVTNKNTFGLGWIVIYSSLQKVNQLQWVINLILFAILILSAIVIIIFSSLAAKKISAPFSSLNQHIRAIAERKFSSKISMPVDDELQELVNNINVMSEKLETYDKAQKTFLQNVSHEFRTPLMSIQSYAEGIKYDVVGSSSAVDIIIDETKRMTHLVEDLLYLSRLDAIEESYHFSNLDLDDFMNSCIERINGIAIKGNIRITVNNLMEKVELYADEEKLSRAITNIISNCIRYAKNTVAITSKIIDVNKIELSISDDGPGFDPNELSNIFERFYRGKKGIFGLGLAISKNVIEKHKGEITAANSESGAIFIIQLPILSKQ